MYSNPGCSNICTIGVVHLVVILIWWFGGFSSNCQIKITTNTVVLSQILINSNHKWAYRPTKYPPVLFFSQSTDFNVCQMYHSYSIFNCGPQQSLTDINFVLPCVFVSLTLLHSVWVLYTLCPCGKTVHSSLTMCSNCSTYITPHTYYSWSHAHNYSYYIHTHAHTHTHTQTCMHEHIRTHTNTYTHMLTFTYIHLHAQTHKH